MDHLRTNIDILINRIHERISQLGNRSFFNQPANSSDLENLEKVIGLSLPNNLKNFYLSFNGGCIADTDWETTELDKSENLGAIKWNSNYILSTEEIIATYTYQENSYASCDIQEQEALFGMKLLPFLHTSSQELLIIDCKDLNNQTPILDAFHEWNCNQWPLIYPSFESLLDNYIENDGRISTIGNADNILDKKINEDFPISKNSLFKRLKSWWRRKQIDAYLYTIEQEGKSNKDQTS